MIFNVLPAADAHEWDLENQAHEECDWAEPNIQIKIWRNVWGDFLGVVHLLSG